MGKSTATEPQSLQDKVPTSDLAALFGCKAGTIRRGLCVDGHYLGIKPIKLPNGRLLWPTAKAYELLEGCDLK